MAELIYGVLMSRFPFAVERGGGGAGAGAHCYEVAPEQLYAVR